MSDDDYNRYEGGELGLGGGEGGDDHGIFWCWSGNKDAEKDGHHKLKKENINHVKERIKEEMHPLEEYTIEKAFPKTIGLLSPLI